MFRRASDAKTRFVFESCNGKAIYEFEQTLSEVIIRVDLPSDLPNARSLICDISARHLRLGRRGASELFIDESLFGTVVTDESTWQLEDGQVVIYLQKAQRGLVWESALTGRHDVTLNPADLEEVRQELLRERWAEENPGMDFRDAQFNGAAPDPRSFMGGVSYS